MPDKVLDALSKVCDHMRTHRFDTSYVYTIEDDMDWLDVVCDVDVHVNVVLHEVLSALEIVYSIKWFVDLI